MSETARSRKTDDRDTNPLRTDENESDELFSDDECDMETIQCFQAVSISYRPETPLSTISEVITNAPIVPTTPLSLVPFLNKTEQWTSDLETPQGDKSVHPHSKPLTSSTISKDIPQLDHTSEVSTVGSADDESTSVSPVIVSRRARKRSKRRCIFKTVTPTDTLAMTSNECTAVNVQVEVPAVVSKNTNLETQSDAVNVISTSYIDNFRKNYESQVFDGILQKPRQTMEREFQTHCDTRIDTSKQALSKVKLLSAEELCKPLESSIIEETNNYNKKVKEREVKISNVEFKTARGKTINVSEEALSKAKTLFAEELCKPLETGVTEEIDSYYKKVKEQEVKILNVEFKTARGSTINVSEQALSKAKTLFAEELCEPLEPDVTKEINSYYKRIKEQEVKIPNIEFKTGRGRTINVSEQALSKAKALFAEELCEPLEPDVTKEINRYHKKVKEQEVKIPNVEFKTGRGGTINVSEQALSKAKALFAEELCKPLETSITEQTDSYYKRVKEQEIKIPNVEFKTGRGRTINVSEQALSKAKALFAEELCKPLETDITEQTDSYYKRVKEQEVKIPNVEFKTGRGRTINVSEQALSKAKALFAEELCEPEPDLLEPDFTEEISIYNKRLKEEKIKVSNVEFKTASGGAISVSEQALSKAQAFFKEDLSETFEPNVTEKISSHCKEFKEQEVKIKDVGFQTARGAPINVSKQALSKAEALFANELNYPLKTDVPENMTQKCSTLQAASSKTIAIASKVTSLRQRVLSSNVRLNKSSSDVTHASSTSLQKRKLSLDDSVSLENTFAFELKKARLSDKLFVRQLFPDNPCINNDNTKLEDTHVVNKMLIDDPTDDTYSRRIETSFAVELSNKIVTKAAKLISDKKEQIDTTAVSILRSPERDIFESIELNAISSPVIGGQSTLWHHRNLRHRTMDKRDMAHTDKTCERIDENILNAGLQTSEKLQTDSVESVEYGDTQMMMDFIDESSKIVQDRMAAALKQEKTIAVKRRHGVKQLMGHLYRYKQINSHARTSLRDVSGGLPPLSRSYQELIKLRIPPNILAITAVTAISYKFRCSDFYGDDVARSNIDGIEMEDGARLIMDENGYAGVWEFLRAFLASPGVDPNLVPARWVENHYRWIVWKLASMDRTRFGSAKLPRALTPSRVMAQLKYRYDREIDRSQRPAIRRILEKDEVASKKMILCVSSIVENNNTTMEVGKSPRGGVPKWRIELTDGWYSVPACLDIEMIKNISTGRIREGTKLLIFGADLLNCDEGCYPLEAPADVCLKLHTNSTRRARWDAKLGFTLRSGPIPIKLHNVCPNGGLIGKMTTIVARVYPMLYHERTASGESIFRNAKCEEKVQSEYERQCRSKVEAFYDKAENDFREENLSSEIDNMATQLSRDRERSSQELQVKEERYKQKLLSKLRESLPAQRQVSSLLKVRVCDGSTYAILSIWSPAEEIVDIFKEGMCISLCNVIASGRRGCELQLTARRSAIFNSGTMHDMSYPCRVCTPFYEISSSEFVPPYGEFDTVGFICLVGPAPYSMKDFEVIHLTYPKVDSSSSLYLSILFWQGIANYGYTDILTVGSIVACNNLEWRRATSWNVPVAYCTEKSTFTRNPRRNHLCESFESLKNLITNPNVHVEKCISELNVELQKKPTTKTPSRYTPVKNTPSKIYNSALSSEKKLVDYTRAVNSRSYIATNPAIQKRLDKLMCYSEPPELSPIIIRSSKRACLNFRSPVRFSELHSTRETSSSNEPGHLNQSITQEKQ